MKEPVLDRPEPEHSDGIFIVVAAYNEAAAIGQTIESLKFVTSNVVVVDDCSGDPTACIALSAGAQVLRHPINLGQGAALQTGIDYALSRGAAYVVTFDADGQHIAADVPLMFHALRLSGAEIALGSRFLGDAPGMPLARRLMLKAAVTFTHWSGGGKFSDVHNGFRIMTRKFLEHFRFRQNRMAHASEVLEYITKNKILFIEHPVTIAYNEHTLRKGQKNINSIRIILELLLGRISR